MAIRARLAALHVVPLVAAARLATWGDLRGHAVGAVLLALAWGTAVALLAPHARAPGPATWLVALAVRAALAIPPPTLSDDLHRYLWEGRVLAAGANPAVHPPDDPALAALRDANWERVAHRSVPTIYPPLALAGFRLADALDLGPTGWRLLVSGFDLATVAALARLAPLGPWPGIATFWALHPLPVLESGANGHLEAVALCAVGWAWVLLLRGQRGRAGLLLVAGALVKVLPLAFLAPLLARARWRDLLAWAGLPLLATLPLALDAGPRILGGWPAYALDWRFNALGHPLLEALVGPGPWSRALAALLGGLVVLAAALRRPAPWVGARWIAGAAVLLSPVVHPWYLLWPLLPALVAGSVPWVALATGGLAAYLVLDGYVPGDPSTWQEVTWVPWMERGLLLVGWWWARGTIRPRRCVRQGSTG